MMKRILSIIVIQSILISYLHSFEIAFFNVGQGNFTVMKDGDDIVIIDAGTSKLPKNITLTTDGQNPGTKSENLSNSARAKDIVNSALYWMAGTTKNQHTLNQVKQYLSQTKKVTFILSHPDKDHYSLILELISPEYNNKNTQILSTSFKDIKFYIGQHADIMKDYFDKLESPNKNNQPNLKNGSLKTWCQPLTTHVN